MKSILNNIHQTRWAQGAGQVRSLFGINREMLKKYLSEILFFENTTQKGKIWR